MANPNTTVSALDRTRVGKFSALDTFLDGDENNVSKIQHYVPASQAELAPGHIIHIKDNSTGYETRIHNRIMLVIKRNAPVSMVCYAFCRHDPPLASTSDAQTHWLVCQSGSPPQAENPAGLPLLEVALYYKLSPESDNTINIRDPWNVEYEVEVAKLGIVPVESYREVRCAINKIFLAESPNSPVNRTGTSTGPIDLTVMTGSAALERTGSGGRSNEGTARSPGQRNPQGRRSSEQQRINLGFKFR